MQTSVSSIVVHFLKDFELPVCFPGRPNDVLFLLCGKPALSFLSHLICYCWITENSERNAKVRRDLGHLVIDLADRHVTHKFSLTNFFDYGVTENV